MVVTYESKINELRKSKRNKETKRIIIEFLKKYGDNIIQTTSKFKSENGQGALFITLVPNSEELDLEYFKLDDLDGNFKQKILNDPDSNNTVYFAIRLYDTSYQFHRKL